LYTLDSGIIVTHATSTGSSSGGVTALSQLLINTNKDWLGIGVTNFGPLTGVTAVQYVDTGATPRGTIFGDTGNAALGISLASGGKLLVADVTTNILQITDSGGLDILGTHNIDLNGNNIFEVDHMNFTTAGAFSPSIIPSIGYSSGETSIIINTGATSDFLSIEAGGEPIATISRFAASSGLLTIDNIIANDLLQIDEQLFFTASSTIPSANGEFRRNGDDVKVFSGNALRNLSDVGIQTEIRDDDTFAVVLDTGPTFIVKLNDIQKLQLNNTTAIFDGADLTNIGIISMNDGVQLPTVAIDVATLTPSSGSGGGLAINLIDTSFFFDVKSNNRDAFHIDELRTRILSTAVNSRAPLFSLFRDRTGAAGDLGLISFDGRDDADKFETYGVMAGGIIDPTSTSKDAAFAWNLFDTNLFVQQLRLESSALRIRKQTTDDTLFGALTFEKADNSPGNGSQIGRINYQVIDDTVITIYAQISAEAKDVTDSGKFIVSVRADNQTDLVEALSIEGADSTFERTFIKIPARIASDLIFQDIGAGTAHFKIAPNQDQMTILVQDNATVTTGTAGTLATPAISVFGADSAAQLDVAFGNHKGAIGLGDGTAPGTMYMRHSNGNWSKFIADSIIVAV